MSWVYIKDISKYENQSVTIKGWLYSKRSSGKIHFLEVRDGTGIIQCILEKKSLDETIFSLADSLTQETSIIIEGNVACDKRSKLGFEIHASNLVKVSDSVDYPISPKEHGVPFLLDHRHLWLRSKKQHAILKIRAEIIQSIRDFFNNNGFTLIDAPIFTPSSCEGTSTLFETNYFDTKAYLTQSGQLYMEAACMAFGKVYCFGPTFRAEKSKTRRHLTEFWMVEPEMAFFDLNDDMNLAEDFVVYIVERVLTNRKDELEIIERDISKLEKITKPFARISYDEAVKILQGMGRDFEWGNDLGAEDETILSQKYDTPVIIHRYPNACKAFYMKEDPENPKVALCMDILAPEGVGEIIGGSQREDNIEILMRKIEEHKLNMKDFGWYLDLRKYGSCPHAGFGLGIERTIGWICNLHHVRETIPFPRMMERLTP